MSQATAYEQLMLELVNAARVKAGVQPLAFNGTLNLAADGHTDWMIATDTFSHTGANGSSPSERIAEAGYGFSGTWASAENIAWASVRAPTGLQDEVMLLHTNLMNSPGHKANILNATFREIGIGFDTGEYQGWNGAFVTENFALSGSRVFLTGVALDDRDGDRFYDVGEGLGGITVTAVSNTGAVYTTTTLSAGGYNLALAAGSYTVTFSGKGIAPETHHIAIASKNVKLDLLDASEETAYRTPPQAEPVAGTALNDILSGTTMADVLKGFKGHDTLYGRGGADRIYAGQGKDQLFGGTGKDHLFGGKKADLLNGGGGKDVLTGGSGADLFQFRGKWGKDKIRDFQDGTDRIDLRDTGLSLKKLSVSAFDADQDGLSDDTLIVAAPSQTITLLNVKAVLIGASDFLF